MCPLLAYNVCTPLSLCWQCSIARLTYVRLHVTVLACWARASCICVTKRQICHLWPFKRILYCISRCISLALQWPLYVFEYRVEGLAYRMFNYNLLVQKYHKFYCWQKSKNCLKITLKSAWALLVTLLPLGWSDNIVCDTLWRTPGIIRDYWPLERDVCWPVSFKRFPCTCVAPSMKRG